MQGYRDRVIWSREFAMSSGEVKGLVIDLLDRHLLGSVRERLRPC